MKIKHSVRVDFLHPNRDRLRGNERLPETSSVDGRNKIMNVSRGWLLGMVASASLMFGAVMMAWPRAFGVMRDWHVELSLLGAILLATAVVTGVVAWYKRVMGSGDACQSGAAPKSGGAPESNDRPETSGAPQPTDALGPVEGAKLDDNSPTVNAHKPSSDPKASDDLNLHLCCSSWTLFSWHRIGLGYVLFVLAFVGSFALVGLLLRGAFPASASNLQMFAGTPEILAWLSNPLDALRRVTLLNGMRRASYAAGISLFIGLCLSMVGSLLWIAIRMEKKADDATSEYAASTRDSAGIRTEAFDPARFFGGLWLRLAQALLYTLGIFLLIWTWAPTAPATAAGPPAGFPMHLPWIAVYGFFIGVSVKAFETLFTSFGERLAQAAEALLKTNVK
jgi:hypothetical protein